MLKKFLDKMKIFNNNFFKMAKKKKFFDNLLVIKLTHPSKKIVTNINNLPELLIFTVQDSPLFLKYLMFNAFVINPTYNIAKTYKEKKYNNALDFFYKLYANRNVYCIQPYRVMSIVLMIDIIKLFF